jgi:glucose/arabinose dehydrogenase
MRLPVGVPHRARVATTLAITALLAVVVPAVTHPAGAVDPRHVGIRFATVATGLTSPVAFAAPNDGSRRLFIVEQAGRIRVYVPGSGLLATPYLDIRSRVGSSGNEQGLLGIVFHRSFSTNGYFYVYYTDLNGNLRISRFHATPSANTASASSEYNIITIAHPTYANHNGGQLAWYGAYLFIGTGDGGGAGDPSGNAQNVHSLLGKILRIDVDHVCYRHHYCNPTSNPYYGKRGYMYEIWEWGLRNPWRFSFNRSNGILWIGDVGQDAREEVDFLWPGQAARNFGWDCREGTLNTVSTYGGSYCSGRSFTGPIYQYGHSSGRCAIVGGYQYTGTAQSSVMGGLYLYADYCTGEIWGLVRGTNSTVSALVGKDANSITSFGEDVKGEIYVLDTSGTLRHIYGFRR